MPLTSLEVNRIDSIRIVTFILFFVSREGMNKTTNEVKVERELDDIKHWIRMEVGAGRYYPRRKSVSIDTMKYLMSCHFEEQK
jgi:hypothetical protein